MCACDCVYKQHIRDSSVIQHKWCVSVTHTETMLPASASQPHFLSLPLSTLLSLLTSVTSADTRECSP